MKCANVLFQEFIVKKYIYIFYNRVQVSHEYTLKFARTK
jgi:hypothetical protein